MRICKYKEKVILNLCLGLLNLEAMPFTHYLGTSRGVLKHF